MGFVYAPLTLLFDSCQTLVVIYLLVDVLFITGTLQQQSSFVSAAQPHAPNGPFQ